MPDPKKLIYMDYQATTPVDPQVFEKMAPLFTQHFGNASSSVHTFGWYAEEAVKQARETVAASIGASPSEIVFTSGATESNNLAILGVANRYQQKGNHIITVATEHKAVLDPCRAWESLGGKVTYLGVDSDGLIDLQELENAVTPATILISVMHANNEIGVIQPLQAIGELAKTHGILFHSDASQSVGKMPLNVNQLGLDLVSMSGHKIYGPKGIGVLYVRRRKPRVSLMPLLFGGGHEAGRRPGTLNVPGIVGFSEALKLCLAEQETEHRRLLSLRETLLSELTRSVSGIHLNGCPTQRLPGNLNFSIENLEIPRLFSEIPHIAISSKSACSSGSHDPSHVLKAIGKSDQLATDAIRLGLGRFTTEEEVTQVANDLKNAIHRVRTTSTRYANSSH